MVPSFLLLPTINPHPALSLSTPIPHNAESRHRSSTIHGHGGGGGRRDVSAGSRCGRSDDLGRAFPPGDGAAQRRGLPRTRGRLAGLRPASPEECEGMGAGAGLGVALGHRRLRVDLLDHRSSASFVRFRVLSRP